jgi:Putative zinc-finger
MSPRPDDEPCAAILPLLEPYLDGELSAAEALRVREHVARCASCAEELRLATAIAGGLRALPQLDCPPAILERVRDEAGAARVLPFDGSVTATRRPRFLALAAALAGLLLGATLLSHLLRSPEPPQPTPREIARATAEARFALAYVGRVSRRAGLDLKDELLPRHLVAPAARTLSRSLGEALAPEPDSAPRQGS